VFTELLIGLKYFLNRNKNGLTLISALVIVLNICFALSQNISYGHNLKLPEKLGVKIAFPFHYQQVPTGEVPMFGSSTDNELTDCIIYADWNDDKKFKEVTPIVRADITTFQHGCIHTHNKTTL
jgi:hypothetical protein